MNGESAFLAETDVSRETLERLRAFAALLKKWNPSINLVARSTLSDLWIRHFLDSAQIFDLTRSGAKTWADLGTGGGFPGLVVAILADEKQPEMQVTCIESDLRKATFLRTVVRDLGLETDIVSKRVEDALASQADVVSARALAPLTALLPLVVRHLGPRGVAVFPKGAHWQEEVAEALETWAFEMDTYPSKTSSTATILKLGDIRRV